nr:hypothetical protein [Candidatus Njordarchaeota archaeon]
MSIPEWEIEETIVQDPRILEIPGKLKGLKLIDRQRHLRDQRGYSVVDLLFQMRAKYVIVEVKCNRVEDKSVVAGQLLSYRDMLSKELGVQKKDIICAITSPKGFSNEVKDFCNKVGVLSVELDENRILDLITQRVVTPELESFTREHRDGLSKILRRRNIFTDSDLLFPEESSSDIDVRSEIKSVYTLVSRVAQDEQAKAKMASLFKEISIRAPIRAHEVGTASNGKLMDNDDMWFWMFYSVMDRRANASTFVKAKKALESEGLFHPRELVRLAKSIGETSTIKKVTDVLEKHEFPLPRAAKLEKNAFSKSILDAAIFIHEFDYDFERLYQHYVNASQGNLVTGCDLMWSEFMNNIYGAGPRIASQFIRGMVLKGGWTFPLNHDRFLEKCRFNVRFAGRTRLGLIQHEDEYEKELGRFADKYLSGNRGIIAHVLWYIRKMYCNNKPLCDECKLSGYCIRNVQLTV